MNTVKRSRRVLAGLAGLALGVVTAFAAASPAQAQGVEPLALDTCAGTNLVFSGVPGGAWTVTVAGETFFPAEGDEQPDPGEVVNLFIPAGAGEIEWSVSFGEEPGSSGTHTWVEPEGFGCDEFPPPTHTQPTCDAPGTITIPELPDLSEEPGVQRSLVAGELRVDEAEEPDPTPGMNIFFQLDGSDVEDGSTHEVEPGTHEVTLHLVVTFGHVQLDLIFHRWVVEIEEPDCPDEGDQGDEADEGEEAEEGEGGGELPKTGVPTGLLAGAAALLLVAGGGMYLVARRRRITFTA